MPLFPLPNVVLFPQMPMPLHIFEGRYCKMVADVLSAQRVIGMVLLQPGWEAAYKGRPAVYAIGCAGRVEQCEPLDDGRFNIVLRGLSRFRIVQEHGGEPYRMASIEPLADAVSDPDRLEEVRRRLLQAIGRASDGPALLVTQPELPHELFVNALSQSLNLTPVEKQSLLDCDGIDARCERLLEILDFRQLEDTYGRRGDKNVH